MGKKMFFLVFAAVILSSCGDRMPVIYENEEFCWYADSVRQGEWVSVAPSSKKIVSSCPSPDGSPRVWECKNDISSFGTFTGCSTLETALYNMSADELVNLFEADTTFRTGALWGGVWTRDISYSIILSLSEMAPVYAETSLMRKVDSLERIIQDTGTGGSWPCSSDRVVWAVAAWQLYTYTGDVDWLERVYSVIRRTLEADRAVVFDSSTGLYRGESSFIDWREQSYPKWMQPADIYMSECLGTNAVYYSVLKVMHRMAALLEFDDESEEYERQADALADAINENLWMEDKGYYAQFLYGRDYLGISPRSETLGESLAVLSGIASPSMAEKILRMMPVAHFGPTIFWPQIADVPAYHNNASWPFVTAYYALAAAKVGNKQAFLHAMAGNVRAAAIYATNHENFVSSSGSLETQMNSHNMLWSIAGMLGIYRKVLLGIHTVPDGIVFSPFIPKELDGERSLKGFRFRDMVLDITVKGYGRGVESFTIDGMETETFVPAELSGRHEIVIRMDGTDKDDDISIRPYTSSPLTPVVLFEKNVLTWTAVPDASSYVVFRNGVEVGRTGNCRYTVSSEGSYQVMACNAAGICSFLSEPAEYGIEGSVIMSQFAAVSDNGKNRSVELCVTVPESGNYSLAWIYANGNGDVTSRNMCANRSVFIDGELCGVSVFPQRGDSWELVGSSSSFVLYLEKGPHDISLKYLPTNVNMNITTDCVHIKSLRLLPLEDAM